MALGWDENVQIIIFGVIVCVAACHASSDPDASIVFKD
jgi:hypothetical protein